jgi:hypothetical protein
LEKSENHKIHSLMLSEKTIVLIDAYILAPCKTLSIHNLITESITVE